MGDNVRRRDSRYGLDKQNRHPRNEKGKITFHCMSPLELVEARDPSLSSEVNDTPLL